MNQDGALYSLAYRGYDPDTWILPLGRRDQECILTDKSINASVWVSFFSFQTFYTEHAPKREGIRRVEISFRDKPTPGVVCRQYPVSHDVQAGALPDVRK
jgi:hypothetical protein